MNVLDFIVLIPVGYFAVMGFKNGLIREVLGVVGIVLSVFLTFAFMHNLADIIVELNLVKENYAPFISGAFIFIGTLATVQLVAWAIKRFLEKIHLSTTNRILGLVFGTLKSSIIISAFLILLAGINIPGEEVKKGSFSYPYLLQAAPIAYNAIAYIYPDSDNFAETIKKTLKDYNPIDNISD